MFDQFWGLEINGKVFKKCISENKILVKKKFFGGTVNQLKKTSDCIKIDPPGPGRSLEKNQKKSKNRQKNRKKMCFSNFVLDLGDEFGYNRLSFWAGRRPLKKYEKNDQNFQFFFFFSNFSPDLGDEFGYNRLSFWAGLRPLKNHIFLFFLKIYFFKIFFWGPIHSFPTPRSGQKNISFFPFFHPILPYFTPSEKLFF